MAPRKKPSSSWKTWPQTGQRSFMATAPRNTRPSRQAGQRCSTTARARPYHDPTRSVHGPAHGRDVDADLVGDLLHLERLDVLRPLVEEGPLVLDDRPRHPLQRAAPLLDRVHQPLGRLQLALQVLLGLGVGPLVAVDL